MRVVFLTPMAGREVMYLPNEVYDLEKAFAKRLVDGGICVYDSEDVKEEIRVVKTTIGKRAKVVKKKAKK